LGFITRYGFPIQKPAMGVSQKEYSIGMVTEVSIKPNYKLETQ